MTNEQLRLLLMQISERLKNLANEMEPLITEGQREYKKVWVGEGKEPSYLSIQYLTDEGYDFVREGEWSATSLVGDFADELEEEANKLVNE